MNLAIKREELTCIRLSGTSANLRYEQVNAEWCILVMQVVLDFLYLRPQSISLLDVMKREAKQHSVTVRELLAC